MIIPKWNFVKQNRTYTILIRICVVINCENPEAGIWQLQSDWPECGAAEKRKGNEAKGVYREIAAVWTGYQPNELFQAGRTSENRNR